MKANIFSRLLIIAAVVYSLSVCSLYAQSDPSKEILVYFSSGIDRAPIVGQAATIRSIAIQRLLTRFNIDRNQVVSAFPNFNEADTLKRLDDGRTIGLPNMARIFKIRVPSGVTREEIIDSLKKLPNVLFAEPNGRVEPYVIPNDQYFSYQWALQPGGGTGKIQAPEAWDITTGNSNNIIGIVDGGVDPTHPDLSGKVSGDAGYGYGWSGHGIHVAGIASANTNNITGVAGVDWNAQIHAQRVDNTDDAGTVDAVNYSNSMYVFNNSWGLAPAGRYSTTVRMAFAYAYKMNRTAIVAMGNNNGSQTQYPAGFGQGIIAVGATDQLDQVAGFSDFGNHIDVSAPGVSIYSTYRNPDYQYLSGTSMAAPHVTGIASLLKAYNPNLYNDDIEHIIQLSADDITTYPATTGWDQYTGFGRVNAKKALDYLRSPYAINQWTSSGGTTSEIINFNGYFYGLPGAPDGFYVGRRYEVRKNVSWPNSFTTLTGAWGRGVATVGYDWSPNNSNFTMGYCEVVPGTLTKTSATLRTWVYEISRIDGSYYGWYPCRPENVNFAYTILTRYEPLTLDPYEGIVGPSYLAFKEWGTWTAYPTGGSGNYSYQWYVSDDNGSTWAALGTAQSQSYRMLFSDFIIRCDVHDNGTGENASASMTVHYGSIRPKVTANAQEIPKEYFIASYPNPFNPAAVINYQLPVDGVVKLTIFDVLGREVKTIVNETKPAGYYKAAFNGSQLPSGIYLARISVIPNQGKRDCVKTRI